MKNRVSIDKVSLVPISLVGLTLLTGGILMSSRASADDVVDQINITVSQSCTITGSGMTSHNADINNGQYNSSVGETTITALCNDNLGFAIYAIGYTDDTDGKTVLTNSTLGSTYDIATGTATSGNTSNWAMKLSTITSPTPTYPIIIAGSADDTDKESGDPDYSTFQEVPDDYTLVAKRKANTDVGTSAEGSTVKTTYQAYISKTQPAGTYTGQVKYTLVHPHNASAPVIAQSIDTATTLQDATYCDSTLTTGQVYTLTDSRDGNSYKVAKLADGNCWMLDNLALDPTDSTTAANMDETNTNAPTEAITNYLNGGSTNTGWSSTAVVNATSGFNSYIAPMINNASKNTLVTSYGLAAVNNQAKVGVYYNYCAATVGTYCYAIGSGVDVADTIIDAPYDLCPAGWRMPTGGSTGDEYNTLYSNYNTTQTATDTNSLQYNLSTPLSGYFYDSSANYQGSRGRFWSSTWYNSNNMYFLYVNSSYVNPTGWDYRLYGYSMRCILSSE